MSDQAKNEIISARFSPNEIKELRRIAAEQSLTVSALVRRAVTEAIIESLRSQRDALPTVPGIDRSCGNLGVHDEISCSYRHCGRPVQLWSKEAWDLEFAARALEDRLERAG